MKRSPMAPRKKPLRAVNPKRRKERHGVAFGSKAEWLRQMSCCVCGRQPSDPHHVRSRGAGGTAKDLVPLCRADHRELHQIGARTFAERHEIDLEWQAERYEAWWQEGVARGEMDLGF